MPISKNIENLVINKVESKAVYDYMVSNNLINEDELYLIQDTETGGITVDSALSETSENPVQNKVINAAIDNLNTLVGDTSVAEQINTAVSSKQNILTAGNNITIEDNVISAGDGLPETAIAGIEWKQSNLTNINIGKAHYGNGVWAAGSTYPNNGGLYYSNDGITWNQSNITKGRFGYVYYSKNMWIATSEGNGLYYSVDGMTWTQSNITSGYFYCAYYANNLFIAGGSSSDGIYYSTDGMSWTQSNITRVGFDNIYYSNNIWVAGSCSDFDGIYYSIDGMTWTQSNITSGNFIVYYDNNIWVAGNDSDNGIYYSIDGITWTQSNITNSSFKCVYYSKNIWVACSHFSNSGLYYSNDGMTWEQSNITEDNFNQAYYSNNIWIASSDSNGLYYSNDGMTWIQSNITEGNFESVYCDANIWIASGKSNNGIYYSTSDIGKVLAVDSTGNWSAQALPKSTDYTVTVTESTPEGYAKAYTISQPSTNLNATINIPKDMVVSSGTVVTNPENQAEGTYLVLTLANADSDKVYINVSDLIEYVTSGSTEDDQIKIQIDSNHKVTATLKSGSITKTQLDSSVQASLDKADSALQSITVDSALSDTSENPIQNKAVNAAITNLNTLVGDTSVAEQINTAVSTKADASHSHDDIYYTKSEIDNYELITTTEVDEICVIPEAVITVNADYTCTADISFEQAKSYILNLGRLYATAIIDEVHTKCDTIYALEDNDTWIKVHPIGKPSRYYIIWNASEIYLASS